MLFLEVLPAQVSAGDRYALVELLVDAVNGGASVGFLPPLTERSASTFWDMAIADTAGRVILVA